MTSRTALDRLRTIGPIFRSKEAIAVGVSWRDLYALRDAGEILVLSRGLYQLTDAAGVDAIDFIAVCARAPKGMVCLNSALAHWDLSDEIPPVVHLAVPEGVHRPTIDYPPTEVHVFNAATFDVGRIEVSQGPRQNYWICNRERTVVDAFRLRHLVGEDLAIEAIRRFLRSQGSPAELLALGRKLRAGSALTQTLRLLTS